LGQDRVQGRAGGPGCTAVGDGALKRRGASGGGALGGVCSTLRHDLVELRLFGTGAAERGRSGVAVSACAGAAGADWHGCVGVAGGGAACLPK